LRRGENKLQKSLSEYPHRERDERRIERKPQGFFLAFEMGHFLDSHTSGLWCPVFFKGEENAQKKSTLYGIAYKN